MTPTEEFLQLTDRLVADVEIESKRTLVEQ